MKPPVKILVVDDEEALAQMIRLLLERKGYQVPAVLATGEETLAAALRCKPDLVLMDIHLAGAMDGIEAARQIQAELDIPVVYLTGDALPATLEEACATKPFGYLLKPFDEGTLHSTIQLALRNHELERRLKLSEARHRTLTEAIPQKVWVANESGLAVYFNSQWVSYTGMKLEQSQGESWLSAINPVEQARFKAAWLQATADGTPFETECRLRCGTDLTYRWHLARAVPLEDADGFRQWFGTFTDIENEKRHEEALRLSEAQKRAVLEAALDGIITMDSDGRILEFNPAAEQMFGRQRMEVVGQPLADIILPAALREKHRQMLSLHLTTGDGGFLGQRTETTGLRADGGEFAMELAFSRVPVVGQALFTAYARSLTGHSAGEISLDRLRRERLDWQTRAKTLGALVPTCSRCRLVHSPAGEWVNLEEWLILRSDSPPPELLCPKCEESLDLAQEDKKRFRLWSKLF